MRVLHRRDPDRNMHRFCALQVLPTLFGEWTLTTEWGRIGSAGQVQHRFFPNEAVAAAALERRLKIKVRRGYSSSAFEPARQSQGGSLAGTNQKC
jgi:predicted DNA-binding WGR domain protein